MNRRRTVRNDDGDVCAAKLPGMSRVQTRDLVRSSDSNSSHKPALLRGYDVTLCTDCGAVYADKIPPQSAFDHYYREL